VTNLTPKAQRIVYLLLAGLILINLPVYFFLVRPEIQADQSEKARDDSMRLELRKRASVINFLKGMESKMNESHKSYDQFTRDYLFSKDRGSSELLRELDQLCSEAGLSRNRSSFKHDEEAQFGMRRVSMTLPVEGSYTSIRKFLNLIESRPKFIIVDSMVLDSEREGTGLIRMEMRLITLFGAQR
jgi:Tfp pilus assembly protein PilO